MYAGKCLNCEANVCEFFLYAAARALRGTKAKTNFASPPHGGDDQSITSQSSTVESLSTSPMKHNLLQPSKSHHNSIYRSSGGASESSSWRSGLDLNISAGQDPFVVDDTYKSVSAGRSCIEEDVTYAWSSKRPASTPIHVLFEDAGHLAESCKRQKSLKKPSAIIPIERLSVGRDWLGSGAAVLGMQPQPQQQQQSVATPPETRACHSDCDSSSSVILNSEAACAAPATPHDAKPEMRRTTTAFPFLLDLNHPPCSSLEQPSAVETGFCLSRPGRQVF